MRNAVLLFIALICAGVNCSAQPVAWEIRMGDEYIWHVMDSPNSGAAYTKPVFARVVVRRDTVVSSHRYFLLEYPAVLCFPYQWLRSDSFGVHTFTEMGDTLVIPFDEEPGASLLRGVRDVTGVVETPGGARRGYEVRGTFDARTVSWVFAEGLGLVSVRCNDLPQTMDEQCRLIRFVEGGSRSGLLPAPIDVPVRRGDVLVHGPNHQHIQSGVREYSALTEWLGVRPPCWKTEQIVRYEVSISQNATVKYKSRATTLEYYPAYIPEVDTVILSGTRWTVAARFDTTVFGTEVRAFTLVAGEGNARRMRTVADRFGVILEQDAAGSVYLESCVVDGQKYNRNSVQRRIFPLCAGSTYEYSIYEDFNWKSRRTKVERDTLIDGETFYWYELPGIIVGGYPVSDLRGWFRETEEGLMRSDSLIMFPSTADYGDATPLGIIRDIDTLMVYGVPRVFWVGVDVDYHYTHQDTLVEGVGLVHSWSDTYNFAHLGWHLDGARICDELWGRTLATEGLPCAVNDIALHVWPNPRNRSTGTLRLEAIVPTSGEYNVSIHDALGRECTRDRVSMRAGRNTHDLSLNALPSGMYLVRVSSGMRSVAVRLVQFP